MKKKRYLILINMSLALCLFSCKKDDNTITGLKPTVTLPAIIKTNRTLKSDTIYTFGVAGVIVTNNASLTIEAGTVIKAIETDPLLTTGRPTAFIIDRGAKIIAEGTPEKPIVFTSGLEPGKRNSSEWQGLYILGKAPLSAYDPNTGGASETFKLPGLNADFPEGGGNNPADNSGVLRYVRIEFAGNGGSTYGLGCVGVGSGTVIEHIEVSYNLSGFGFFGGTVNAKNLVAFNNKVAGFVYANGYTGKQQFILSYKHPYFAAAGSDIYTSDAIVILNDIQNNPVERNTRPILSNLTIIGPYNNPGYNDALPWNAAVNVNFGSTFSLKNSVLMGMPKGGIKFSDDIAAQHLINGLTEFTHNLVHSNVPAEAFTIDPNSVYSVDQAAVDAYAKSHNNVSFNKPEEIKLSNPFHFELPDLTPQAGSVALSGADFTGADYQSFFKKVSYRGAFDAQNWMKGWTNFYPVTTNY